jgi:hypothetical protein
MNAPNQRRAMASFPKKTAEDGRLAGGEPVAVSGLSPGGQSGRNIRPTGPPDASDRRDGPHRGDSVTGLRPSIEVRIDEIALQGFPPAHRYLIGDAIERELIRLLASGGELRRLASSAEIDELDGGVFRHDPGRNPSAVGGDIARAIYRRLSG